MRKLNNYTIQTYFASLCTSYGVIYDEVERLIRGPYPNGFQSEDLKTVTYWGKLASMKLNEIFNFIKGTMKQNNAKIVITSYYEVIVLIKFYKSYKIEDYDIINMDDEFENIFPKDEISQRFRSAYNHRLQNLIYDIALEID